MFSIHFDVEKTITVDKSAKDVFRTLSDFNTWRQWSPWLCQEPDCPVTIEGEAGTEGHEHTWNGKSIGSGTIRLVSVMADKSLEYDLTFLKPWKSRSKCGFRFVPNGQQTDVVWWMQSSLPIFLFFLKKMMIAMIGSDYNRGLSMFKELMESGEVQSKTEIRGIVDRPERYYIGIRRRCGISEIGPAMEKDFSRLGQMVQSRTLPEPQQTFAIYHKYDFVKEFCECTSGFLYESKPDTKEDLEKGQFPNHKAFHVHHKGSYRHLGNAWSAAMNTARTKHKINKSVPMYEVYTNDPREVSEKDYLVEVYVPVIH